MRAVLDHLVLWVEDPGRAMEFYEQVVGFEALRLDEYRAGTVPFPSLRVSDDSILDLMARAVAPAVDAMAAGGAGTPPGGGPVNHVCFSLTLEDYTALVDRLRAAEVPRSEELSGSFGALGFCTRALYFRDPDGNALEARTYEA